MSLDVYLINKDKHICSCPICNNKHESEEPIIVYSANITHNLGKMAEKAGIYKALWRPYRLMPTYSEFTDYDLEMKFESEQIIYAIDILPILQKGLKKLKNKPYYYKKFDSDNGWGIYDDFVPFVEKYLQACIENPMTIVEVSR